MSTILSVLGISGVAANEDVTAKVWGKRFQTVIGIIAAWLLIQWFLDNTIYLPDFWQKILDWVIWLFFFTETLVLSLLVKNKKRYLVKNWLNIVIIVGCFPLVWFHTEAIIYLRVLRLFILFRIAAPGYKTLVEVLSFNQIGMTLLLALLLTLFSGLLMSLIDPAIPTVADGIWWAWETITTVGYGDEAPSTLSGRILAIGVMLGGAAIFTIITANLAAYLISKSKTSEDIKDVKHEEIELLTMVRHMQTQLDDIQQKLTKLEQKN